MVPLCNLLSLGGVPLSCPPPRGPSGHVCPHSPSPVVPSVIKPPRSPTKILLPEPKAGNAARRGSGREQEEEAAQEEVGPSGSSRRGAQAQPREDVPQRRRVRWAAGKGAEAGSATKTGLRGLRQSGVRDPEGRPGPARRRSRADCTKGPRGPPAVFSPVLGAGPPTRSATGRALLSAGNRQNTAAPRAGTARTPHAAAAPPGPPPRAPGNEPRPSFLVRPRSRLARVPDAACSGARKPRPSSQGPPLPKAGRVLHGPGRVSLASGWLERRPAPGALQGTAPGGCREVGGVTWVDPLRGGFAEISGQRQRVPGRPASEVVRDGVWPGP